MKISSAKPEWFLISPLLVATGQEFSAMKNDSGFITRIGDPAVETKEGETGIVYDKNQNPYMLFIGDNIEKARETTRDLGFVLGGDFIKTNFKGINETLGYCY